MTTDPKKAKRKVKKPRGTAKPVTGMTTAKPPLEGR
jgi:hypothetical protein